MIEQKKEESYEEEEEEEEEANTGIQRPRKNKFNNSELYISQLSNDVDEIKFKKEVLINKIDFLKEKKSLLNQDKTSFSDAKMKIINELSQDIHSVLEDIDNKRNLFTRIQPTTDEYLTKLNDTYLSDYVPDKCQIDNKLVYNEKSVIKFVSSVEEYYLLIQMFNKAMDVKKKGSKTETDRLRDEIKLKLENFQKEKLFDNTLYSSMKMDNKNGMNFDDIIRRSSNIICTSINSPDFFKTKTLKKKKKVDEIII